MRRFAAAIHRFLYCLLHFLPVSDRGIGNCKFVYCRRRRVSRKKGTSRGKDWNRNKPGGETRMVVAPRRILFRDQVERKEFLVRVFLRVLFLRPKDKKLLLPRYGRMIFNELREYLLRFEAPTCARDVFRRKNSISMALEIVSELKTRQRDEMQSSIAFAPYSVFRFDIFRMHHIQRRILLCKNPQCALFRVQ